MSGFKKGNRLTWWEWVLVILFLVFLQFAFAYVGNWIFGPPSPDAPDHIPGVPYGG